MSVAEEEEEEEDEHAPLEAVHDEDSAHHINSMSHAEFRD
jgi:hypothetical protein